MAASPSAVRWQGRDRIAAQTPKDYRYVRSAACSERGRVRELYKRVVSDGEQLTRSERRSWLLHQQLAAHLSESALEQWRPTIEGNLERLRLTVRGQPHVRNLDRWESLIQSGDERAIRRVLTGVDQDSIEMREVSPMGGLLSQEERIEVMRDLS